MSFQRHSRIRGRRNPNARLTEEIVRTIKQRYFDAGDTQGHLARVYQVSVNTIGRIVRGETWNWMDSSLEPDTTLEPALPDIPVPPPDMARLLQGTGQAAPAAQPTDNKETTDGQPATKPRKHGYY